MVKGRGKDSMDYYGPDKINPYKQGDFFRGYIECALWTALDWNDMVNDNPTPMDKKHGIEDFAHSTLSTLLFICNAWESHMEDTLEEAGLDDSRAGHCLWLDQNRHGAGFGDEFHLSKELRTKLREAAQAVGEIDLCIGEDGKIHG